jgi:hypothetical protein
VITANPTDQPAFAGDSIGFTVAASGSPAPSFQWKNSTDGGTTFNNVGGATSATYTHTVALSENGYKFQAVATNTCSSATSTAATLTVTQPATTTALASSANPAALNQMVTFTATVTKNQGPPGPPRLPQATPTGTVQFSIDGSAFGSPAAIDINGIATSGSTSWPAAGNHTVTASYSGDSTFTGGTAALNPVQQVRQGSSTTLGSSANPSVFGQAVTWTATVAAGPPGGGPPTGTVQFGVDGAPFGSAATVTNGVATSPPTSTLSVGNHSVTATYSGDGNFSVSTAFPLTQQVSQAATTLALTPAPVTSSPFLSTVTFTARVNVTLPGAGAPTGQVIFSDGGTTIGIAPVQGGNATFSTNALNIANHTVTASYSGDVNFTPSTRVIGYSIVFPQGGYYIAFDTGYVTAFGSAQNKGQMGGMPLNAPIVGMASTPRGGGYWLAAADGGVFAFGDATFHGSMGGVRLNRPIVGIAATPDGNGYWLVASDGGIFSFGNAAFYGSTGAIRLNRPVVGMAAMPDGRGYWMVASDGGIFSFGSAAFRGSTGAIRLNQPVVGMAATRSGNGYWMVASDGGIFSFGDAAFFGSTGNIRLVAPITGMSSTIDSGGYWLVGQDGGVFRFGDAPYQGSTGVDGGPSPSVAIVGMSTAG